MAGGESRAAGPPFVGRDAIVAELEALLSESVAGRGGVVLLEGEAGIGKTSVAAELGRRTERHGAWLGWAGCPDVAGAPTLWPWVQLIGALVERAPAAHRRRIVGNDGWALEALGPPGRADASDPYTGDGGPVRFALFQALAQVIVRASMWAPLVLVIDDLPWADAASALFAVHLAPLLTGRRALVVATIRTDDATVSEPTAAALADLRRAAHTFTLAGLEADAVSALIDRTGVAVTSGLVDVILDRTAGNPFFVTELLRAVATSRRPDAAGSAAMVAATEVPHHVTDALRRRLARLPTATATLLGTASVLGNEGTIDLLAAMSHTAPLDAVAMVEEATATGLLTTPSPGRWRFTHALVRDALYDGLPPTSRHRLHDIAAETIGMGQPPAIGAQAHHALAALPLGDRDRAVDLAWQAGRQSMADLSFEEAATWFERALAALGRAPDRSGRARLHLALGEARRSSGDYASAQSAFLAAAEAAGDDAELLAAAALGYADPGADLGLAYRADDPHTASLLERALTALPERDTATRVLLLARLGAELYFSTEPARSAELAAAAVAMARRLGEPGPLVLALALQHDGHVVGHQPPAIALAGSAELMSIARPTGDLRLILTAHRARVFDLLAAGDMTAADAEIAAFRRLADNSGTPAYRWFVGVWRAMRALADGDLERVEALADEAFAMGNHAFAHLGMLAFGNYSFVLFFLRRAQGRLAEMEDVIRVYASEWADIPAMAVALPTVLAELGRTEEAAAALAGLEASGFDRLRDRNWPVSWFLLARVAYLVGDRAVAEQLASLGAPLAGQCLMVSVGTVFLGSADLGLAWTAETQGHADEADAWYRQAEETNARLGVRPWLVQAWTDHARLLARRGGPGDAPESGRLAARAQRHASAMGLVPLAAMGEEMLAPQLSPSVFRPDGAVWELSYAGSTVRVPHAKGLGDIAWLLAHEGEPVHVSELIARGAPGAPPAGAAGAEILDTRARRELRARMMDLQDDIDGAEADHDGERASHARAELDALIDTLTAATGIGGRARRLGDDTERTRKAVGVRISNSLLRLREAHPELAAHLEHSIDTGVWCVYRPEHHLIWQL